MPFCSIASAEIAVIASGTSSSRSAALRAVTTISCKAKPSSPLLWAYAVVAVNPVASDASTATVTCERIRVDFMECSPVMHRY